MPMATLGLFQGPGSLPWLLIPWPIALPYYPSLGIIWARTRISVCEKHLKKCKYTKMYVSLHQIKFYVFHILQLTIVSSICWPTLWTKRPILQIPACTFPMLHSEQKCVHFCSKWCIVGLGYGTGASWDLWIRSMGTPYLTKQVIYWLIEQFYHVTFWHSKVKNKYTHKISHSSIWSIHHYHLQRRALQVSVECCRAAFISLRKRAIEKNPNHSWFN